MKKFYPNDGRPGTEITSVDDIRRYMGDVIDSFNPIEIDGKNVLAYMGGQPVKIGELSSE